jgi:hypothetical protein
LDCRRLEFDAETSVVWKAPLGLVFDYPGEGAYSGSGSYQRKKAVCMELRRHPFALAAAPASRHVHQKQPPPHRAQYQIMPQSNHPLCADIAGPNALTMSLSLGQKTDSE